MVVAGLRFDTPMIPATARLERAEALGRRSPAHKAALARPQIWKTAGLRADVSFRQNFDRRRDRRPPPDDLCVHQRVQDPRVRGLGAPRTFCSATGSTKARRVGAGVVLATPCEQERRASPREGAKGYSRSPQRPDADRTRERPYVARRRDACRAVVQLGQPATHSDAAASLRVRKIRGESSTTGNRASSGSRRRDRRGDRKQLARDRDARGARRDVADARRRAAPRVLDHKRQLSGGRRFNLPEIEITGSTRGGDLRAGISAVRVYDAIAPNSSPPGSREATESEAQVLDGSDAAGDAGGRRVCEIESTRPRRARRGRLQDLGRADGLCEWTMRRAGAASFPPGAAAVAAGVGVYRKLVRHDLHDAAVQVSILHRRHVRDARSGAVGSVQEAEITSSADFRRRSGTAASRCWPAVLAFLRKTFCGLSGDLRARRPHGTWSPDPAAAIRDPALRARAARAAPHAVDRGMLGRAGRGQGHCG